MRSLDSLDFRIGRRLNLNVLVADWVAAQLECVGGSDWNVGMRQEFGQGFHTIESRGWFLRLYPVYVARCG